MKKCCEGLQYHKEICRTADAEMAEINRIDRAMRKLNRRIERKKPVPEGHAETYWQSRRNLLSLRLEAIFHAQ